MPRRGQPTGPTGPVLGRFFGPDDEFPASGGLGGPPLAVLSHGFWQERFGGDRQVIGGDLRAGKVVLCDRFLDSSRVYQGTTGNLEPVFIERLQEVAINGVMPDCTLIFDLPAAVGLERARRRSAGPAETAEPDRFEKEELETHEKRREAFLELAEREPLRCRVIDATRAPEAIARQVLSIVEPLLPLRRRNRVAFPEDAT